MQQKFFLSVVATIRVLARGAPNDEVPDPEEPLQKK